MTKLWPKQFAAQRSPENLADLWPKLAWNLAKYLNRELARLLNFASL